MYGRKTALKVKDCTQKLINLFSVYCSTGSIKLQIYLCQLYKVDMDVPPHEFSLAQDIINAQLGLKTLLSSGIEVIAMSQESWTKLAEFADIELPEYQECTTKARQTYRQLPFENEDNTDCNTAEQVCKRSEYFLDRCMSGTELNYRNMYLTGLRM